MARSVLPLSPVEAQEMLSTHKAVGRACKSEQSVREVVRPFCPGCACSVYRAYAFSSPLVAS